MIDLHVHSNFSDGTYTVRELVDYALEKGLKAMALTDHDTVDGIPEIMEYAKEKDLEVVPGIEISTDFEGKDIHVLGYYIDYKNEEFIKTLKEFVDTRRLRNEKMCQKLTEIGCPITMEEMEAANPDASITRAHFATALMNKGFVKSRQEAFDRYIGDNGPCYIPRQKISPVEAVELIAKYGGIPVLAHPILYHMSDYRLDRLVNDMCEAGLIGIETIYATYSTGEEREIRNLAYKYNLLITGGSDFHGENKPKLDLGVGYGKLNVPDEVLDNLKECLKYYVFSDLDDTLFDEKCVVSDKLKEAILAFAKKGNVLIPTSGRPLRGVLTALEENDLKLPGMKIICNNGAQIYDCDTGKPYMEFKLTNEDLVKLIKKADELGIYTHSYTDKNIIVRKITKETEVYTSRVHMVPLTVSDVAEHLPEGAYKLMCIELENHDLLLTFRSWIEENMPHLQAIFSNANYLEVLSKYAGKGNGIKAFCRKNHIPVGRTYACGDQENDISMLKAAGCGVAVANALPSVKAAADIVTENDASHDALLPLFLSL